MVTVFLSLLLEACRVYSRLVGRREDCAWAVEGSQRIPGGDWLHQCGWHGAIAQIEDLAGTWVAIEVLTLEGKVCCRSAPFVVDLLYQEFNQLVLLLERIKERRWLYVATCLPLDCLLDIDFSLLRRRWRGPWNGDSWNGRPGRAGRWSWWLGRWGFQLGRFLLFWASHLVVRHWLWSLSLGSLIVGARVLLLFVGGRLRGIRPRLTILGIDDTSSAFLVFLGLVLVVCMRLCEIARQRGDPLLEMVDLLVVLRRHD